MQCKTRPIVVLLFRKNNGKPLFFLKTINQTFLFRKDDTTEISKDVQLKIPLAEDNPNRQLCDISKKLLLVFGSPYGLDY